MAEAEKKPVMLVAVDDSEHSFYALQWALERFFTPYVPNYPFNLRLIHAKPFPTAVVGLAGSAFIAGDVLSVVETDLKNIASRVIESAKQLCVSKGINNVVAEVVQGDARNVLCEVVEHCHVTMLVLGSHGYGAIKRAVLGSVSDYCAHHAHCSVMIVKNPKTKE